MVNFVVEHPDVAISIIVILGTSLLSFVTWWFRVIRSRLVEHIKREDEVLLPQLNARFDTLTTNLEGYHIDNLKRFADLDKRLAILEKAKVDDINEILSKLDDLAEKMDEING